MLLSLRSWYMNFNHHYNFNVARCEVLTTVLYEAKILRGLSMLELLDYGSGNPRLSITFLVVQYHKTLQLQTSMKHH